MVPEKSKLNNTEYSINLIKYVAASNVQLLLVVYNLQNLRPLHLNFTAFWALESLFTNLNEIGDTWKRWQRDHLVLVLKLRNNHRLSPLRNISIWFWISNFGIYSRCLVSAIKYIISTLEIALKHNLYIS